MFGRRRSAGDRDRGRGRARRTWRPRPRPTRPPATAPAAAGPWDVAEPHPELPRVDLGSLQVPVLEGTDIQLVFAEQHGAWVTVRHQLSELQLQAFAAPKRDRAVGRRARRDRRRDQRRRRAERGARGPVRHRAARPTCPREPGQPAAGLRSWSGSPAWTARAGSCAGCSAGAAADDPAAAAPLEAVLREVVVVRGDHPMPPRDLLELRLPPEAAAALEEQARAQQEEQEQNRFATPPNPFERGPEMTETR